MTLAIKNTKTVNIETQLHDGDVWHQTLTNKKTGEQFMIGLFQDKENAENECEIDESEWHFDELRNLITEHIQSVMDVPSNAKGEATANKRLGICCINYNGYRMNCEFTFEPYSDRAEDGWYVGDAWVLSADAI